MFLSFILNCIHISLTFMQISMRNWIRPQTMKTVIISLGKFLRDIVVYVSCEFAFVTEAD